MITKDAFDRWWQWAEKPLDSQLTIPVEIHDAVMTLTPADGATAPPSTSSPLRLGPVAPTNTVFRARRNDRRDCQSKMLRLSIPGS
jgi:hypothetical protein